MLIADSQTAPKSNTPAEFAGVSAGLYLLSGVFGFLNAQNSAAIAHSRADMIRREADVNAQRYMLQAERFRGEQAAGYLASGVKLTGSPIDTLDQTMQIAKANVGAIELGGEAHALSMEQEGINAETAGRNLLVGGLAQGADVFGRTAYMDQRTSYLGTTRNNQNATGFGGNP